MAVQLPHSCKKYPWSCKILAATGILMPVGDDDDEITPDATWKAG
jgi:hypothetical protein